MGTEESTRRQFVLMVPGQLRSTRWLCPRGTVHKRSATPQSRTEQGAVGDTGALTEVLSWYQLWVGTWPSEDPRLPFD